MDRGESSGGPMLSGFWLTVCLAPQLPQKGALTLAPQLPQNFATDPTGRPKLQRGGARVGWRGVGWGGVRWGRVRRKSSTGRSVGDSLIDGHGVFDERRGCRNVCVGGEVFGAGVGVWGAVILKM